MTVVLVVDDVRAMAEQYAYDLKRLGAFDTLVAGEGREALDIMAREAVDCVILDLEMPGMDGFDVLRALQQRRSGIPVIVYTGTGSYDRCVQALRLGAYNFIDKSEPMERVVQEVRNAVERERLMSEVTALRKDLDRETLLIGSSPAMERLRDSIRRVAPIPSVVLIVGESGVGKDLVARELHRLGKVSSGPLVAINCAALPENLVESELFGHERGAFTGATAVRKGAFEHAHRGTLFLDEIGELPLAAQAKLLRVLEDRHVTRVGGNRQIAVDARVIAATNRDVEREVAEGRFRQDLLFRLNVHTLEVPPLRDRLSDIPELVEHLLGSVCARFGMKSKRVDESALQCLMAYEWRKNNVRELRNIIERMVIATDATLLVEDDVPPDLRLEPAGSGHVLHGGSGRTFHELKSEAERQIILLALQRHDWHITNTARELGLADHSSLLKIMRRHGIQRD